MQVGAYFQGERGQVYSEHPNSTTSPSRGAHQCLLRSCESVPETVEYEFHLGARWHRIILPVSLDTTENTEHALARPMEANSAAGQARPRRPYGTQECRDVRPLRVLSGGKTRVHAQTDECASRCMVSKWEVVRRIRGRRRRCTVHARVAAVDLVVLQIKKRFQARSVCTGSHTWTRVHASSGRRAAWTKKHRCRRRKRVQ